MNDLRDSDRAMLGGEFGAGVARAMRIVMAAARIQGVDGLLDVTGAHVDGCLYHGRAGLDFAVALADGGAAVRVPTTLNVSSLDLLHPELYRGDPAVAEQARKLMSAYQSMGCRPTWTCAPYQLPVRPGLGEHVAWAESNAIVFANSVLGARTDRYGDFIDICAAVTGRVPAAGLHLDEHRRGQVLFRLTGVPDSLLAQDVLYPVLGHLVGRRAGRMVPVIEGLPETVGEDRLKALGAAASSSGAVAMFHAVGITPEASTRRDAFQGRAPELVVEVTPQHLAAAHDELSTGNGEPLAAVSLGTPHASGSELRSIVELLQGRQVRVPCYVNTGRDVLASADPGVVGALEAAGVTVVTDTCTYITPIIGDAAGTVMTDSAKWAWYAPGNLGVGVLFGSREDCIESAVAGRVTAGHLWDGPRDGPLTIAAPLPLTGRRRALVEGMASGDVLLLDDALSFWGGLDPVTGRITDPHHPSVGEVLTNKVLAMPGGRGSSSSSTVLAEALRAGTGPAAIVLGTSDPIIAIGAEVARELYGMTCPVVVDPQAVDRLENGEHAEVVATGSGVEVVPVPA